MAHSSFSLISILMSIIHFNSAYRVLEVLDIFHRLLSVFLGPCTSVNDGLK